jgi:DNA polymerase-1
MNQGGTQTGRFSYSAPNLQNVPKEAVEGKDFYVRKCFVPRPGYCFVMIDYDQQEYRLMVDLAGENELIKKINGGLDVHTATAEMMGVDRTTAKTINFMLLYGGGHEKLAKALGITNLRAKELKGRYFRTLPKVERFIKETKIGGELLGLVTNWMMRRYYLFDKGKAYILPNHIIQGGCADVIKSAMVKISTFLEASNYLTHMLVQVHDELLFEVHESELHLVPKFKEIMESIYKPMRGLHLTCGVDHSWESWGSIDKVRGLPFGKETRDSIQRKDTA